MPAFVMSEGVISCDLAEEVVMLRLDNGVYYSLEGVGVTTWNLLKEPRTLNEVQQTVLKEYDVEPDVCAQDLTDLLEELVAHGLIEIRN